VQQAFSKSKDVYVELSNAGEKRWRHRKSVAYKKRRGGHSARERLQSFRQQEQIGKLKQPYRLMTVKRYQETHQGRSPEEDGVKMKEITSKGSTIKYAMISLLAEGELDYVDEEEEGIELDERLFGFATIVVSKSLVGGVHLVDFTLLRDAMQPTSEDTLTSVVQLAADSLEKLEKLSETSLLGGVLRSQSWLKLSPALSKEFQRSQSSAVKRTVLSDLTVAVSSLSGTPSMSIAELKSKLATVFDYVNTLQGDHNDVKTYRSTLSMLSDWGYSLVKVSDDYLAKAIDLMIKQAAVTMVLQACLCAAISSLFPVLAKGM